MSSCNENILPDFEAVHAALRNSNLVNSSFAPRFVPRPSWCEDVNNLSSYSSSLMVMFRMHVIKF